MRYSNIMLNELSPTRFSVVQRRHGVPVYGALLMLAVLPPRAAAETTTQTLGSGVTYTQTITTGNVPLIVNVLRVDLSKPDVRVRCGQALDAISTRGPAIGREPVTGIVTRNRAVAGVNADFFPFTGDPLGLAVRDGELLSEPMPYRACIGFGPNGVRMDVLESVGRIMAADGTVLALDGINRVPQNGETVALTPSYAAQPVMKFPTVVIKLRDAPLPVRLSQSVEGAVESVMLIEAGQRLPLPPRDRVLLVGAGTAANTLHSHCRTGDATGFRFDLVPNAPPDNTPTTGGTPTRGRYPSRAGMLRTRALVPVWRDVEQAVGGGPMLVRDGKLAIDGPEEDFGKSDFIEKRHPRTALGVTKEGKLLIVTVDGRMDVSKGANLTELAKLMLSLGAVRAINLDGGGSTTMVVRNGVVNAPSDGRVRSVANGLLVYAANGDEDGVVQPASDTPNGYAIQPLTNQAQNIQAGESAPLQLLTDIGTPVSASTSVVWGTTDGFGFVSQRGVFRGYHAGTGTVRAVVNGKEARLAVRVVPNAPTQLRLALLPSPSHDPNRNILSVALADKWNNPIAGETIAPEIFGGIIRGALVTGSNGHASAEIVWDAPEPNRKAVAQWQSLRSAVVRWQPPASIPVPPVNNSPDPDDH